MDVTSKLPSRGVNVKKKKDPSRVCVANCIGKIVNCRRYGVYSGARQKVYSDVKFGCGKVQGGALFPMEAVAKWTILYVISVLAHSIERVMQYLE